MAFNPSSMSKVLVRATNWLGDAVMSLPAIRAIRQVFPHAQIAVLARPSVADLYARETAIDRVIAYPALKGLSARREFAARLRARAIRRRDPAAERLRCGADRVAGGHSGAHRIPARRARHAADARHRRCPSRATFRVTSASTIWNCCAARG